MRSNFFMNIHKFCVCPWKNKLEHDKTNKMACSPAKTQISLGICPIWSKSSMCPLGVAKDPWLLYDDSEDWSDWVNAPVDAQAELSSLGTQVIFVLFFVLLHFCFFFFFFALLQFMMDYLTIIPSHVQGLEMITFIIYIWATTRQNMSSGVSDQARHKPACTATEASESLD